MRFEGRMRKDGKFWLVEIPAFDAITQGRTKREALGMARDLLETMANTPGFEVTARCPDGIVEAIESRRDDWWAMGTQFHPEASSASALDLRIFEEFLFGITGRVAEMRMVA